MSFLTGKTVPATQTDPAALGLKGSTIAGAEAIDPFTGLNRGGGIPQPLMDLFQKQLGPTLAQAKESAGTLTGSGLDNILGATAGRSLNDFLTNMLSQRANRATALTGQLLQPQQKAYQPGFLDYLFKGVQAAAPLIAAA